MLGDGNCDDACNTVNCDGDNYDCPACSQGCFGFMVDDGTC